MHSSLTMCATDIILPLLCKYGNYVGWLVALRRSTRAELMMDDCGMSRHASVKKVHSCVCGMSRIIVHKKIAMRRIRLCTERGLIRRTIFGRYCLRFVRGHQ